MELPEYGESSRNGDPDAKAWDERFLRFLAQYTTSRVAYKVDYRGSDDPFTPIMVKEIATHETEWKERYGIDAGGLTWYGSLKLLYEHYRAPLAADRVPASQYQRELARYPAFHQQEHVQRMSLWAAKRNPPLEYPAPQFKDTLEWMIEELISPRFGQRLHASVPSGQRTILENRRQKLIGELIGLRRPEGPSYRRTLEIGLEFSILQSEADGRLRWTLSSEVTPELVRNTLERTLTERPEAYLALTHGAIDPDTWVATRAAPVYLLGLTTSPTASNEAKFSPFEDFGRSLGGRIVPMIRSDAEFFPINGGRRDASEKKRALIYESNRHQAARLGRGLDDWASYSVQSRDNWWRDYAREKKAISDPSLVAAVELLSVQAMVEDKRPMDPVYLLHYSWSDSKLVDRILKGTPTKELKNLIFTGHARRYLEEGLQWQRRFWSQLIPERFLGMLREVGYQHL
jgi:hypothetical protein